MRCRDQIQHNNTLNEAALDKAFVEAETHPKQRDAKIKKPWTTENTYNLIIEKHKLEQDGPSEALTDSIKKVRRAKRKDWRAWVKASVTEDMDVRDKWLGIKYLKQKFAPNLYERADRFGKTVSLKQRADAAADYLAEKQWGPPAPLTANEQAEFNNYYTTNRNTRVGDYDESELTLAELKLIIKKMKRNKAAGPDDIPMEYFKWLDDTALEFVRELINIWWNDGTFPEDKLRANIASIYKKGNPKLQENYRPIFLLNSIYKLYASFLQRRLAKAIDPDLLNTQYGFRAGRSTSTPVACVRRVLDRAEATKMPIFVTFLDWEKAFDKVKQDRLMKALERMNIPTKYCTAIGSLYSDPKFRVKMGDDESEWKSQKTGIRQGCPLSPYLFIILMTVLFRDVKDGINLDNQSVDGLDFNELLYADDTALITTTAPSMNKLVGKIDTCAAHFGLKFNYSKCIAINYNTPYTTKFKNGDKIPTGIETVYLGATIRKDHDVCREITKRIGTCFATLKRMDLFWNNANCPLKFRIQVHDAVIRSKLVYGMESVMITKALMSKIDTLQLKGLRKNIRNENHIHRPNQHQQKSIRLSKRCNKS